MEDITQLVSQNLKRIREERKLSLDKLSDLTGVSKSMLGQIERGESSPTITVVWKIANGLKTSFTSLLSTPQSDTVEVPMSSITPLTADDGKYRLYPYFPIEENRSFEVYGIEIDPSGSLAAEPHPEGTQEFILVTQGVLGLQAGGHDFEVPAGDSIRFRADRSHGYNNSGAVTVRCTLVIHYPG